MTADDLHARADCARRNPVVLRDGKPVVTITCDHADALADLIDAANTYRALMTDLAPPDNGWRGQEIAAREGVFSALVALDGTP